MSDTIETSGDLRRVLAQSISDIRTKKMDVDQGKAVAMLAKEINSSIQTEVNVAKVRQYMLDIGHDLGKVTHLGKLVVSENPPEQPQLTQAAESRFESDH